MKATCEKPGCGKPAVAQARFGEVTVARACPDHEPELLEFINRHIGGFRTRAGRSNHEAEWEGSHLSHYVKLGERR